MHPAIMLVRGLELNVNLGWEKEERESAQTIKIDIEIYFDKKPQACTTDELAETVCYFDLCKKIKATISQREFALVEHLAQVIFDCIHAELPEHMEFTLHLTKFPVIEGLTQGVRFTLNHRR